MATLAQKSQQQDYLKKLLGKQDPKANKVEKYLKHAQNNYEQKIRTGSFKVKQTSDIIQTRRNNYRTKVEAENMKYMKKSLEKTLKLVDSRIEQLTEPDKRTKKIDDQQRLKFVSQMTKARRQLQKKRDKKIQQMMQKNQQQLEKQLQEQKKKEQQAKKKRKQQAIKRTQSLQLMRKNKKNEIQNQNKQLKAKLEQKTLLERMNERYQKQEESLLQQRKKKLAQIRSIHKPLTKSQFQLHIQKIDQLKSQRSRVIEKGQISKYISDQNNFYKSRWYEKTKKQQVTYEDDRHQQQLAQVKQMKDKLKKYSEYVRQNFKPQIDLKKSKQLQEKIKSKSVQGPKTQDLRQLGLKYLQWSKQHVDPKKKTQQNDQESKNKIIIRPINYLQQLKKNSKGAKNSHQFLQDVKKKNISEPQKVQKILDYAQNLERKAKLREQKAKINNMVVDEELDNMYMQAIQMKLKMLGSQQQP